MVSQKEPTDKQLVERVKRGDKRAFDLLTLKYLHKIISLVGRYLRDQDEVQDVAQEAFIKAYRALPNFRGDSAFYTWLYRIAINAAKNHLVSKSRRPPDTDIDVDDGEFQADSAVLRDDDTPEANLATSQMEDVIYKAIADLPEELKVAVTLREFEGLSYEEIAEVMECPWARSDLESSGPGKQSRKRLLELDDQKLASKRVKIVKTEGNNVGLCRWRSERD